MVAAHTASPAAPAALPLAGMRVIDMATVIAAPFCATLLGEFGPAHGDG